MALGGEVVDLVGAHLLHDADQVGGVGQIAIVQEQTGTAHVRVLVEMIDPGGVERGSAPLYPVHLVPPGQQQLGQIGPVLTGHPGDQRHFGHQAFPKMGGRASAPARQAIKAQ